MLCLFIIAKCFAFTGMINVHVQIRSAPKSSSPQSSESVQCENTETPSLRSLMDLQKLEIFFHDFKFLKNLICLLSLLRVIMKKLNRLASFLQLNCLKTSFVALLMER